MKERYLTIMEHALRAYPKEHIDEYFARVRQEGLTEHGFPRLTANIGLLIAHGKRQELLPLFLQMMDFCCDQMHRKKAANDFSVKEIIFALLACEENGVVPKERTEQWREGLRKIVAMERYTTIAPSPDTRVGNWAAYGAASEYMRGYIGLCDPTDFLNLQIPSQLLSFDENGMYRDPNEPMLYDLATRCQLDVLLHFGYDGPYREEMDGYLRKAGRLTLQMQSVTGEIPFGGRSNQFLFNEAYLAAVCEFEANRYQKEGDEKLAGQFKMAAQMAADAIERWIAVCDGKKHVKNNYPWNSSFGCEDYAYFDKYMITLASFIYVAYLFADDRIVPVPCPAQTGGFTAKTSAYFHKFFANCGGYQLEFDTNADPHYDATGLGRIHKAGVPGTLGLSSSFTATPVYQIDGENPGPLALCAGIKEGENTVFPFTDGACTGVTVTEESAQRVCFTVQYAVGTNTLCEHYTLTAAGVDMTVEAPGKMLCYALPVFTFDGKQQVVHTLCGQMLTAQYGENTYTVSTDGVLTDEGRQYKNRNGVYQLYLAQKQDSLHVHLRLE